MPSAEYYGLSLNHVKHRLYFISITSELKMNDVVSFLPNEENPHTKYSENGE